MCPHANAIIAYVKMGPNVKLKTMAKTIKPIAAKPEKISSDRKKEKSRRVMNTTAVSAANSPSVVTAAAGTTPAYAGTFVAKYNGARRIIA